MKLKEVFGENRVVALAGDKSTGKTNNLLSLLKDFRKENKDTPIYVYGFDEVSLKWLFKLGNVFEVSMLEQLSNKEDSLIVIDELQKLRLNDRRYKYVLDEFIDFIYHKNNWVIFATPNLREFNSIIGNKIERWLLKSLSVPNLVNGSQLKDAVLNYNGRYKSLNSISIPESKLLILNDEYEKVIELDYIKEVDNKKDRINIFV